MYVSGTYGGAFRRHSISYSGEPDATVPMLWDGYTMGRKGKPAKALDAGPRARRRPPVRGGHGRADGAARQFSALRFSSPEYFVMMFAC